MYLNQFIFTTGCMAKDLLLIFLCGDVNIIIVIFECF